ncbi:MAG TPA: 30S ribosomal protein S20, partial [Candidatus Paceibacterota bacterium]
MPITSSAKKALRAGEKKRVNNLRTKAAIDAPMKAFKKFIKAKKIKEAEALVPAIYKALDKAAKRKYIKANTASRYKSRIMASIKR